MPDISKVSGVAADSVKKIDGVSKASIGKLNELSFASTLSIVTTNLVHHLDAANSSSYPGSGSTWFDLTSNSIDGTFRGAPTYSSTDGGGSFFFDGVDDGIKFDYDDAADLRIGEDSGELNAVGTTGITRTYGNLSSYGGFTYQAWVKIQSGTSDVFWVFANNGSVTTSEAASNTYLYYQGVEFLVNGNNGRIVCFVFDGNGSNTRNDRRRFMTPTSTIPSNGTWMNVAYTLPNDSPLPLTGGKIYLNGSEVSNLEYSNGLGSGLGYRAKFSSSQSNKYHAGIALRRGSFRRGFLGEHLWYNDVLTDAEILQNYNATKTRYGF